VFDVPYALPSGRIVKLRGKWDSIDSVDDGKKSLLWLQENKTKGEINEQKLQTQLTFDLQTMMYVVAMQETGAFRTTQDVRRINNHIAPPFGGVRYNVIRRPLSGGKGSIRRHEARGSKPAETKDEFYARLGGIISVDPAYYFMRWEVLIDSGAIKRFRFEFLDPMLEGLCDWWYGMQRFGLCYNGMHWRHPFGVRNILDEGGSSELDEYLATGSLAGLRRVDNLYEELA